MVRSSYATRLLRSSFVLWVLGCGAAIFFLLNFDKTEFANRQGSVVSRLMGALSVPRINLGIDLQGGVRLVLKMDESQVVKSHLQDIVRDFERELRRRRASLPLKKGMVGEVLQFSFADESAAVGAQGVLAKARIVGLDYKFAVEGRDLKISLSDTRAKEIKADSVERAVTILRDRLDSFDVKGLAVNRHGNNQIVVTVPGNAVSDVEDIKNTISRSARLEFKIVEDQGSRAQILKKFNGILPADKMLVPDKRNSSESEGGTWYLVSIFPDVAGKNVASATFSYDDMNRPAVAFKMDSVGSGLLQDVTERNLGRQLAIIMDEKVFVAPVIQSAFGSSGQITGCKAEEVTKIVSLLRAGSLDAAPKIESETRVGASLGQDSINQGLFACFLAFVLLFFFSLIYYKLAGLFAFLALLVNMLVIMVFLAGLKATLTLSGIAGMVLTLGMAIDASILIYESIKEALAMGLSYDDAVARGFKSALAVILDSNITTFVAGLVLYYFGGPSVKGFAVTLMLGIVSTMVSGVFFLRSMFDFSLDALGLKKVWM